MTSYPSAVSTGVTDSISLSLALCAALRPYLCVQVQMRDYVFESRHRPAFGEEDIVNMFPVVKHLKPTATDATRLVQNAQEAVQQGERHNNQC